MVAVIDGYVFSYSQLLFAHLCGWKHRCWLYSNRLYAHEVEVVSGLRSWLVISVIVTTGVTTYRKP